MTEISTGARQGSTLGSRVPRLLPAAVARPVPGWALAVLGLLALALVTVAAWSWTRPDPTAAEESGRAAQQVAERATVAVLSYDYRTLAENEKDAESFLTARYRREQFAPLWATIAQNAPTAKTVITATVAGSGLIRTAPDQVQVLVLVDRPTSNADSPTPTVYRDHVTVTMVKTGGRWLIDGLATQ